MMQRWGRVFGSGQCVDLYEAHQQVVLEAGSVHTSSQSLCDSISGRSQCRVSCHRMARTKPGLQQGSQLYDECVGSINLSRHAQLRDLEQGSQATDA